MCIRDSLAGAAKRAGLDLAELDAEAQSDAETLDQEIAANQVALEIAGHWGVPTLVSVSYTHLDVYKRQAPHWATGGEGRGSPSAAPISR